MTSSTLMEKPVARVASIAATKKTSARVAFLDMKEPARAILADCFKQFGIESVPLDGDVAGRIKKEKFEACVLKLSPETASVLDSARSSASNSRMVIYVLGGSAQEAMRYSRYGINAVFHEPLERPAALKLVRATRMLVFHEFRRYVRIPVITEIAVITNDNHRFTATSKELSCGGMSMTSNEEVSIGTAVEISFALLTLPRIWVRGIVSWRKPNKTFGVRFDSHDDRRLRIKDWVEAYLET
jgi:Tfp pilus assembly protein PilZ